MVNSVTRRGAHFQASRHRAGVGMFITPSPPSTGYKEKMKTINVSFDDNEMEEIEKAKKGQSWREFILNSAAKIKYPKEILVICPNCKRELRFAIDADKKEWIHGTVNPLKDVRDAVEILKK